MNSVILSEEEISIINSLLKEIKDIPLVEAVILAPSNLDISTEKVPFSIEIIYNSSKKYDKLFDTNTKRDINNEVESLQSLMDEYTKKLEGISNNKFVINCDSKDYYSLLMCNPTHVLFITLLVNSTILYDRFGDLTDIKETAEKYDDIEIEYPIIENIDSITNANDKVSGK